MLGAIILGAGLSKRMGCEKLLLPLGEESILEKTLASIEHPEIERKILVTREEIYKQIKIPKEIEVLINLNPEKGQGNSLKKGVSYGVGWEGCIIFLADQPLISKTLVFEMIDAWKKDQERIVCAQYKNKNGHPVIFGKKWMPFLMAIEGDHGARKIIKENKACVRWIKGDETCLLDVDTREDYKKIKNLIKRG